MSMLLKLVDYFGFFSIHLNSEKHFFSELKWFRIIKIMIGTECTSQWKKIATVINKFDSFAP